MASKTISEITINKIRIGGKAPKAIHKGGVEVKKVTKGSTVVYQKEDIKYEITGSGNTSLSSDTKVTFNITSKRGSGGLAISASNVSVTAGSYTNMSVSGSGTSYTVTLTVAKNTTTSVKTFTIKVTQPTSGLSINVSAYQSAPYLQIRRVGFRFYGSFPSNTFAVTFNTAYIKRSGDEYNVYFESLFGNSGHLSTATANSGTIYYSNYLSNVFGAGGANVVNGNTFGANFGFGATWAGSSGYRGSTWKLEMEDSYSGKSYLVSKTSSKTWQVGVQPASHGVQTTFRNISATASIDLVVNVRWSW